MTYASTKDSLKNIVEWLAGTDKTQWEDQAGLAAECISELRHMARPIHRPDKLGSFDSQPPMENPDSEQLDNAIPHAEAMLRAIRNRNRTVALNSGRAALAAL